MALNAFSVVGESLNFSMRRFETVFRTAALPLALVLVFNMAATFGYLSVVNERVITFKDIAAAGLSWAQTAKLGARAAQSALGANMPAAWAIWGASLIVNAILVSTFMAPLIRYAGLGEKPAPGFLHVPFGFDQARFLAAGLLSSLVFLLVVYAPVLFATFSIVVFLTQAMTKPFASFPDPDSLHTIDIVSGAEVFGMRWFHQYQVWGAWGLGAAAIVVALLILHLRPQRDAGAGFLRRALGVTVGVALYLALCVFLYVSAVKLASVILVRLGGAPLQAALSPDALAIVFFGAAALAFAGYFSLQLFPYAGIAVCRRSLAFTGVRKVTGRYDLLRLALALVLLGVILFATQILLIWIGMGSVFDVLQNLYRAFFSFVRLSNGGEGGEWVLPLFRSIWAIIGIGFTMLWTAFAYGVTAGLWGRLYRESAKD